ncbi:DUF948 domain-containing protein [Paenibacillus sp. 1011MAR3C5]|uniref:DUF948 domain-containing protein n=1 Tax=Paenibacillus sp. 1011MAR3C5 TaxID=1675787 RepID=UPI000E6C6508|nr:DUF948 domain-containing protein [Paenibacillus sp. 1011MAR3C5]RJE89770.1 DUF948 domain-containing protein [Paenibacillus sp. 1011MAR3C5]
MAEWSAVAAAAAFVVLVAGLLIGLRMMLRRLEQAQASVEAMQADLHRLSTEIGAVLQPVEQTARGVQRSLEAAGGLVQAVRQVSGTVERTSSAVERVATTLSASAVKHAERIATSRHLDEAAQWAELGLTAWQLWQSRSKADSNPDSRPNG